MKIPGDPNRSPQYHRVVLEFTGWIILEKIPRGACLDHFPRIWGLKALSKNHWNNTLDIKIHVPFSGACSSNSKVATLQKYLQTQTLNGVEPVYILTCTPQTTQFCSQIDQLHWVSGKQYPLWGVTTTRCLGNYSYAPCVLARVTTQGGIRYLRYLLQGATTNTTY